MPCIFPFFVYHIILHYIIRVLYYYDEYLYILFWIFSRLFIPLPKLTAEGYRISLSRLRTPELDGFEFADYVKVNFMSIDIRLSKLDMFKKEIFIFDLSKFTLSHLTTVLPQLKKFIYCATVSARTLRINRTRGG